MKEIIEKLKKILIELDNEKGPVLFYALFLREDSPNKWDLIVSSDWLESINIDSYRIVTNKIQNGFSQNELLQISRVVVLDENDPMMIFLRSSFNVIGDASMEFSNCELSSEFFKFPIKHAYILRCIKK